MYTGRQRYMRLVKLYLYHKEYRDADGEPFGYVRTVVRREKGSSYNMPEAINNLFGQMQHCNYVGATRLPVHAFRFLPNMYITVSPCFKRLFNFTALVKRNDTHLYMVYNTVSLLFDVPSRMEMIGGLNSMIQQGIQPAIIEQYTIQDCLNDAWANVGTQVNDTMNVWMHLKEIQARKFKMPDEPRDLGEMVDYGEPGDSYLRSTML